VVEEFECRERDGGVEGAGEVLLEPPVPRDERRPVAAVGDRTCPHRIGVAAGQESRVPAAAPAHGGVGERLHQSRHVRNGRRSDAVTIEVVEMSAAGEIDRAQRVTMIASMSPAREPKSYCAADVLRWPAAAWTSRRETASMPRSASSRSVASIIALESLAFGARPVA
jgi:hypothetical protein